MIRFTSTHPDILLKTHSQKLQNHPNLSHSMSKIFRPYKKEVFESRTCAHELKVYDQLMTISKEQVQHLAKLVRIEITDSEVRILASQLSDILEHFEALEDVDTKNIVPTAHPAPLSNIMRTDEVKDSLPKEEVLQLAPETEDGLIRVRAVLE